MPAKLKRRSLKPAPAVPAPAPAPAAAQAAPAPAQQQPGSSVPPLTVAFLTKIPGIGKVVAERVIEVSPTVAGLWNRWDTAGDFAKEIKGLSPAGASKIWDAVRGQWPEHASKPIGNPAATPANPPVVVSETNELPAPYNTFTDEQLRALLPTLPPEVAEQVQKKLVPPSEVPADGPPPLPEGFESFNPDQLATLAPTLSPEQSAMVTTYLEYVYAASETNTVAAAPEPVASSAPVQQQPAPAPVSEPAPAVIVPQQTAGGVLDFFKREAGRYSSGGTGSTPFHKMTSGTNVLRLLGPYKPGASPFRVLKVHSYRQGGRTQFGLDYTWLLSDEDLQRHLLSTGKIHEHDLAAAKELGDPLQQLPLRLSKVGRKDEAKNLWARTRYLWNVMDQEGNIKVYESSKTFFDQIATFDDNNQLIGGLLSVYPDLFDYQTGRNLQVNGNGKDGTERRYSAPIALEASPIHPPDQKQLHDLDAVAGRKAKPWNDKAAALFELSGTLANSVDMRPDQWLQAADRYVG